MIRDLLGDIPGIPSPSRTGARPVLACPSWCPEDPDGSTGHHLLDLEHRLDLGAVVGSLGQGGAASAPRAAVDLRRDDAAADPAVDLTVLDPRHGRGAGRRERPVLVAMTADEARRLAGTLLQAADLLDGDALRRHPP